jgi:teichuronic acid biosynthesis glycosyltransferase TuaH
VRTDVVIVTHDSAPYLERIFASLGDPTSVVVIDNVSTDDSVAVARRAGARVVENDVNAGFGAAANQGAAFGDAETILFLNPDAAISAADLALLRDALAADPQLGVVSPRIRYDDGTEQQVLWPFPTACGAWREALGLHRFRRTPSAGFVIGACFLIRRSLFDQLGGFDTRYWLHSEETDLCARATAVGARVAVVDAATAVHAGAASTGSSTALVAEHFARGGERFVAEREGSVGLVSYRLAKLVGSLVRVALPGSAARKNVHRDRRDRYARTLRSHPTTVALDSPATSASSHTLVVCSLESWDDVWRRNQFLVRELLALDPNLRVLFVEPAYDWVHELRGTPNGRRSPRRHGLRPVRPDGRVLALQPAKIAPRVLGAVADTSLRRQVRAAAEAWGFDRPTLWINDVHYAQLASATRWPTVYDITDDWLLSSQAERIRHRLARNERLMLRTADEVVVCSPDLATSRREQRADLHLVPNAVDLEHFTRPTERPPDLPTTPTAVYVGTLHDDRVDAALLSRLALDAPDLSIVLVGPDSFSEASRTLLAQHGNVHVLGARDYASIPAYLQHADVVIVPHVVSPFTESLDPIKAYECLAVGTVTVATPVAGFRDLGDPVVVAAPDRFVTAVTDALASNGTRTTVRNEVPSWRARSEQFSAVLAEARAR